MSYNNGPKAITDGLIFYADAGNDRSVPVKGTNVLWYNLIKSNNLSYIDNTNSCVYTTDGKGAFAYVKDFATYGTILNSNGNSLLNFGAVSGNTNDFAIEFWAKHTEIGILGYYYQGRNSEIYVDASNRVVFNLKDYINDWRTVVTLASEPLSIQLNKWTHIVITRVVDRYTIYINGISKGSLVNNAAKTSNPSDECFIGRTPGGPTLTAYLSIFRIYKGKGLSVNEVLQNFNTFKSRYGLYSGELSITGDILSETFEGSNSGYDLSGWYPALQAGSSCDPDYTINPAPGGGVHSLRLVSNGDSCAVSKNITSTPEIWMKFQLRVNSGDTRVLMVLDSIGTLLFYVNVGSVLGAYDAGNNYGITATGTFNKNTWYYVWLHYKAGTGSNGVLQVAFSETAARPNWSTMTNGTFTGSAYQVSLGHVNEITSDWQYDNVNIYSSSIDDALDISADVWQTFEFSTVDTASLASNDNTTLGSWTVTNPSSVFTTTTSKQYTNATTINGLYDTGSKSLAVNISGYGASVNQIVYTFPSPVPSFSLRCWVYIPTIPSYTYYPIFGFLNSSDSGYSQYHFKDLPLSLANVPITTESAWYRIEAYWANGSASYNQVYDTSNNLIGTYSYTGSLPGGYNCAKINFYSFGYSVGTGLYSYMDNIIIKTTSPNSPIGP